jgi:hypothetical protein
MAVQNLTVAANADDGYAVGSVLNTTYATPFEGGAGGAGVPLRTFWRFITSAAIAQNSVINSAILSKYFVSVTGSYTGYKIRYKAHLTDNSAQPSGGAETLARTATTAYLEVNEPAGYTSGVEYEFDLTAVLQELVNAGTIASGSAITIFGDNAGTSGTYTQWNSYPSGTKIPTLDIDYSDPPAGGTSKSLTLLGVG